MEKNEKTRVNGKKDMEEDDNHTYVDVSADIDDNLTNVDTL